VAVSVRGFARIADQRRADDVLGLARAMVAQLASYHSPVLAADRVLPDSRRLAD
jgi:hypothetical protein